MLDSQIGYEVARGRQEQILREAEAIRQSKVEGPVDDREIRNYRMIVGELIEAVRVLSRKVQYSGSA